MSAMSVFVEGPGAGRILAAQHPAAAAADPVSAAQRGHSHTAAGEGRPHSSGHVHTHAGKTTYVLRAVVHSDCSPDISIL